MSNPTTNYKTITNGISQDLSGIFQPLSLGTAYSTATGYKISTGADLNTIFAAYTNTAQAIVTGYKVNGADLNTIFAKKQDYFPTTNSLYTTDQTFSNFIMPPAGKNFFSFSFCGSGGDGYTTISTTTGGGGSGGWIQALNIPYLLNSSYIVSISIDIGGTTGNSGTNIVINYSNNTTIVLYAGGGFSSEFGSGNNGAAGGTCAITTNTTSWNSSSNYTFVNGAKGGNANVSGISSGKTTSGSGAIYRSSGTYGVNDIARAGPSSSFSLGNITANSQGGGRSPTLPSGYGAGGASTPPNYPGTGTPSNYRAGKSGCCIILLT